MLFEVKSGTHKEGSRVYTKGQIVESDIDLSKIFRNKFIKKETVVLIDEQKTSPTLPGAEDSLKGIEDVKKASSKSPKSKSKVDEVEDEEIEEEEVEEEEEEFDFAQYGKDVTAKFSEAEKKHCKVYYKNKKYMVIDETDGEPLNNKGLAGNKVNSFLKQL